MERLGVLLVEGGDGQVSVQLFANPETAAEVFRQLTHPTKLRATFLTIDWKRNAVCGEVKELPEEKNGERPVGWKLGEGPIFSVNPVGIQAKGGDKRGDG